MTQADIDNYEGQLSGRFAYFDSLCQEMSPFANNCDELKPEQECSSIR